MNKQKEIKNLKFKKKGKASIFNVFQIYLPHET